MYCTSCYSQTILNVQFIAASVISIDNDNIGDDGAKITELEFVVNLNCRGILDDGVFKDCNLFDDQQQTSRFLYARIELSLFGVASK